MSSPEFLILTPRPDGSGKDLTSVRQGTGVRWLQKTNGEKILQQYFELMVFNDAGIPYSVRGEWHDVVTQVEAELPQQPEPVKIAS